MKTLIILSSIAIIAISVLAFWLTTNEGLNSSNTTSIQQFERPESQPDIVGVVKSTVGNEITITQYDISEMPMMQDRDADSGQKNSIIGQESSGRIRPENGEERDRGDMFASMESLGDVKVVIPVGIQMIKMDRENATLEDVKNGSILTIWINDEITNKKIAEFVTITNI